MRRTFYLFAAAIALVVSNAAHAANPCSESRKLDMAKTLGHAHGLEEASRIVLEKTGDKELARFLQGAALAKQEESQRQLAALLADRCP